MNYKLIWEMINKYSIYFFIVCMIFYASVYLINGEDGVIDIDDNLDSEITWRTLPKESGTLFSISNETVVPQIMNGLKRNSLNASATNITTFLFYFFPPFYAYTFSFILIKIFAFLGVFLLSSRYILKDFKEHNILLSSILAFTYVLLPLDIIFGMAILGLPLLIYCILNILNKKHLLLSFAFVVIYPFYSSLVLGGYAVLVLMFLVALYLIYKKEKQKGYTLAGISFLIGFLFIFGEINLINQFLFDSDFVSHRTDWKPEFDWIGWNPDGIVFSEAMFRIWDFFLNGYIFRRSHHTIVLIFLLVLGVLYFKNVLSDKFIISTLILLVLISIFYGLYYWNLPAWVGLKEKVNILRVFRFDRIYFLTPAIWYLLFLFLVKKGLEQKKLFMTIITYIFVVLNSFYVLNNSDFKANLFVFLTDREHNMITYRQFYAEELFDEIKQDIDEPLNSFRTVSFGVWPAVSQYNGFYTLDSYQNNYSLDYKRQFRKIIEPELERSERWTMQFDDWGSECVIFSSELDDIWGYFIISDRTVKNLKINTDLVYEMGGRYVFSAIQIENHQDINLNFLKKYTNPKTPLKIYLYKVLPPLM